MKLLNFENIYGVFIPAILIIYLTSIDQCVMLLSFFIGVGYCYFFIETKKLKVKGFTK